MSYDPYKDWTIDQLQRAYMLKSRQEGSARAEHVKLLNSIKGITKELLRRAEQDVRVNG
jgi:hypothetical protein